MNRPFDIKGIQFSFEKVGFTNGTNLEEECWKRSLPINKFGEVDRLEPTQNGLSSQYFYTQQY